MQSWASGSCADRFHVMPHRFARQSAASATSIGKKRHVGRSFPILCLLLVLLGGWTASCGGPVHSEPQLTVRPIKELEPKAIAEAREWKPDAYLSRIYVEPIIAGSQTPLPYGDLLGFDFESQSDPQNNCLIEFRLDGRTQVTPGFVSNPYLDYVPIEPADWTIDSTEAWRIAQENGGSEFLRKYSQAASHVTLTLERQNPPRSGPVLWRVAYTTPYAILFIRIDAKTGAVVSRET